MSYPVSAVLLSHNVADQIGRALDSVLWCDEIFVVDSQSDDGTRKIARDHGATIIDAPPVNPNEPFDQLRQLAVDKASNDLILRIDCDEWFPPKLRSQLQTYVDRSDDLGVVRAPRINHLNGTPLQGGRQWPDYQPVLFNPAYVTIHACLHEWLEIDNDAPVEEIPLEEELLIQHNFADSLLDHFHTQRRYAKIAGSNRPFRLSELFATPIWAFLHTFVEKQGYNDGIDGFALALCWSWYHLEMRLYGLVNR